MSNKQIVFTGKDLIKIIERLGFKLIRINGSHHRLKHQDGRVTTIPVHKNDDIPTGLLRKIIREDLQISMEDFILIIDKS
jgi:predicted RNA binding protein YcfA (HicA-like mRNA interferase family)